MILSVRALLKRLHVRPSMFMGAGLFFLGALFGVVLGRSLFAMDQSGATLMTPFQGARRAPLTSQSTTELVLAGLPCDESQCKRAAGTPAPCPKCEACPPCGPVVNTCIARDAGIMRSYGQYAKGIAVPAAERVNGFLIGELQPELHFRPGYEHGHTDDVEDPKHLIPWLLGNQVNLNSAKRRVYLDLGAHTFDTNTAWFLRTYPVNFDEVHAFEVVSGRFSPPYDVLAQLPHPPNVTLYEIKVGIVNEMVSNLGTPAVDILQFIKDHLKIRKKDTLIVKMDIEGSEWDVLPALLKRPDVIPLIDELFVEIHYGEPALARCGWDSFYPRTVQDALSLVGALRTAGLRTQFWP